MLKKEKNDSIIFISNKILGLIITAKKGKIAAIVSMSVNVTKKLKKIMKINFL